MGREREFSEKVRKAIKAAGGACYPVETGSTMKGFPDLAVIVKGGSCFVELKARPSMLLVNAARELCCGPGQLAFMRSVEKRSLFEAFGVEASERGFVLAECMDGVTLLGYDGGHLWPCACWEGFPSGEDLRDALRAWRVRCIPSAVLEGATVREARVACNAVYEGLTGIKVSMEAADNLEGEFKGKEMALEISRDICDRGRIALLMSGIMGNAPRLRSIEGGGEIIVKEV